ncbi:MAG: hypothetical protein V4510_03955 [bacterium]
MEVPTPPVPVGGPLRPRHRGLGWEVGAIALAALTIGAAILVPQMIGGSNAMNAAAQMPAEGPIIVGFMANTGPSNATAIRAGCLKVDGTNDFDCIEADLEAVLRAEGSEVAFKVLEDMTKLDRAIEADGHPLAHGLGRTALTVYGGPRTALHYCPYVLSSGCFHGVQQAYFDSLPKMETYIIQGLCVSDDSSWRFQCLHGMGHGLELYTNYDLNRTLAYCDLLDGWLAIESCQGGAFMENLVGYIDSQSPTPAGGHNHGGPVRPTPVFLVKPSDPAFPCDVMAEPYLKTCYYLQSSVTLRFNGFDFDGVVRMCQGAPTRYTDVCFTSMGRDAGASVRMDPGATSALCEKATQVQAEACIRGFIGGVVNDHSDANDSIPACHDVHQQLKEACYTQAGVSAKGMLDAQAVGLLCSRAEDGFVAACLRGAAF